MMYEDVRGHTRQKRPVGNRAPESSIFGRVGLPRCCKVALMSLLSITQYSHYFYETESVNDAKRVEI